MAVWVFIVEERDLRNDFRDIAKPVIGTQANSFSCIKNLKKHQSIETWQE
jgi:hypothetical protein